ncbi:MAG TPA: hypothetical protein VN907_01350, partial [Actinomycetes bacterium]|nr:hypothetical protein [Actinomycetes bacterium]
MLVEEVDGDLHAAGDDLGGETASGVFADAAAEDELDLVGAAKIEVVGHQRLKERPGLAGGVQDQGAGHLNLTHRQLPPVAGGLVGQPQRGGDAGQPAVEEALEVGRAQPVADRLQGGRVVAAGEPVGQLGEGDASGGGLAFGPLVAV